MARHRQLPTMQAQLWRALTRSLTLSAIGSMLFVGGAGAAFVADGSDGPLPVSPIGEPAAAVEQRLMAKFECSNQGYADTEIPQSAIVREPSGALRVVSFDEGWRMYTEGGPARLVAVCLKPAR